jgi:hypothetical protein
MVMPGQRRIIMERNIMQRKFSRRNIVKGGLIAGALIPVASHLCGQERAFRRLVQGMGAKILM